MARRLSQAELWDAGADDWAAIQEPFARPVYEAVRDRVALAGGESLLDVGCGAGAFLELAAEAGARVAGIDISPGLIAIAAARVPEGDLRVGDFEQPLPFDDDSFDVVTGFASVHYAAEPVAALRELRRVCKPGGRVAVAVWGSPEECEPIAYVAKMTSLLPGLPPRGPFALAAPGAFEALFREAGLEPDGGPVSVPCPWEYANEREAERGLFSVALSAQVAEEQGEELARVAVRQVLEPFRRDDGSYRLANAFRYLVATK